VFTLLRRNHLVTDSSVMPSYYLLLTYRQQAAYTFIWDVAIDTHTVVVAVRISFEACIQMLAHVTRGQLVGISDLHSECNPYWQPFRPRVV
jgi:hypothetical protein